MLSLRILGNTDIGRNKKAMQRQKVGGANWLIEPVLIQMQCIHKQKHMIKKIISGQFISSVIIYRIFCLVQPVEYNPSVHSNCFPDPLEQNISPANGYIGTSWFKLAIGCNEISTVNNLESKYSHGPDLLHVVLVSAVLQP